MKTFIGCVLCTLFLLSTIVCVQAKEIVVLTSTLHIADFARQIAGERMTIISLLRPGVDPHRYEPTPQDVKSIARADLCLENGLHLEKDEWLRKIAKKSGTPVVTVTTGIQALMIEERGVTFADPHAWLSLKNVSVYVSNILKEFVKLMPEHGEEFTLRAALYMRQIRVLDVWAREQVERLKPELRNLITSHAGFNYFCKEYGFNSSVNSLSIAPVGWSTRQGDGGEATPRRIGRVNDFILDSGTSTLFTETTVNVDHVRTIAEEIGGDVGGILYSDSMGPLNGAAGSYVTMMRENILTITRVLGK